VTSPPQVAWVLFDGVCGLCDRWVAWLLRHDRKGALRFAPLQGETAAKVRARHPGLPPIDETLLLVEAPGTPRERVRVRSDGALATAAKLGGIWRLTTILLRLFPPSLRDAVYRFVARRRKRWFGELAVCRLPTAEERARFLD
jgi:predicted DCC family thiol-disulfide oxidoreductase YuxK